VINACRALLAIVLAVAALAGQPADAGRIGDDGWDRILIADPAPALRSYLLGSGFRIESVERLEALNLSLMIASPPRHVQAAAALHELRAKFPAAILALDDPFYLAQDARFRHDSVTPARQALTAIGWQANDDLGAGVRVGVIDSSLDPGHPALRDASVVQRSFTSGKEPTTDTAHGTAISAMLVGRSNDGSIAGLLQGATLFHASIFQRSRQAPKASSADFLRAINWMLKSGVRIINVSITSPSYNPVLLYAMSILSHEKAIVVAAAGNRGPDGPPAYPAAIESAFAVTAVSPDGDAYPLANTGDYVDIAAPGIDLPTVSRNITSGTSLAVPFVTAAVARTMKMCGVSPAEAEASLQANARDLGPRGWDSHFGWGLLQAPRCVGATQLSAAGAARHPLSTR
jgi:subtilisin family serine protease